MNDHWLSKTRLYLIYIDGGEYSEEREYLRGGTIKWIEWDRWEWQLRLLRAFKRERVPYGLSHFKPSEKRMNGNGAIPDSREQGPDNLKSLERSAIINVLQKTENQTVAAQLLGISQRVLDYKMIHYDITRLRNSERQCDRFICSKMFTPYSPDQHYCSRQCKRKEKYRIKTHKGFS